jgi:hypothetical protein
MARKKARRPKAQARANAERRIRLENARVARALRSKHYKSFEGFVAANSTLSVVQMADKLGVPRAIFISYHARWVRETAKPIPDVEGTEA